MCYCCAIVEAWTKQEAGLRVEKMDPQRCHGCIVPGLPPRWGLEVGRMEALKADLWETLRILVRGLRHDGGDKLSVRL